MHMLRMVLRMVINEGKCYPWYGVGARGGPRLFLDVVAHRGSVGCVGWFTSPKNR